MFAEPSVMDKKLAKQKSSITPRIENKIDIFAKRNTEQREGGMMHHQPQ